MHINYSTFPILDLPDEILFEILNKLSNTDVLYSLIGVNQRLDRLVRESSYTKSINLVNILSSKRKSSRKRSIIDRFCFDILPRIRSNVQILTLDSLSIAHVLSVGYYPKLSQLVLINVQLKHLSHLFNRIYTHQISHLSITIDDFMDPDIETISTHCFVSILKLFTNLKHFQFNFEEIFTSSSASLIRLPSTTYQLLNITFLNVRLYKFSDCLDLLDGRLYQLQTLIIKINSVNSRKSIPKDKKVISNLEYFSLTILDSTNKYDSKLVLLLREMFQLKKLILSIHIVNRTSFIDGIQLSNDFLIQMPHLQSFSFDIITETVNNSNASQLSCVAIQRTFIERGYDVNCYFDYREASNGRCHVYSLPFTLEYMQTINNNFPGGQFNSVRKLSVHDFYRPFEHEFFRRIARSFPMLQNLHIMNRFRQRHNHKTSSIIVYPCLVSLSFFLAHTDYVTQFLHEDKMRLPCLQYLDVEYSKLAMVTDNFTSNSTRQNCVKIKYLDCYSIPEKCLKNLRHYFPSLIKKDCN